MSILEKALHDPSVFSPLFGFYAIEINTQGSAEEAQRMWTGHAGK